MLLSTIVIARTPGGLAATLRLTSYPIIWKKAPLAGENRRLWEDARGLMHGDSPKIVVIFQEPRSFLRGFQLAMSKCKASFFAIAVPVSFGGTVAVCLPVRSSTELQVV